MPPPTPMSPAKPRCQRPATHCAPDPLPTPVWAPATRHRQSSADAEPGFSLRAIPPRQPDPADTCPCREQTLRFVLLLKGSRARPARPRQHSEPRSPRRPRD